MTTEPSERDREVAKHKRIEFALKYAQEIRFKTLDLERKLWREKAKEAKAAGLYSQTTYEGDIANGLRKYAKDYYGRLLP